MTQLRAWLKPNHLTADTSDYTAVPDTLGGVGLEQIIADMQFQGVELQKETIIDIVNRFNRLAAQGHGGLHREHRTRQYATHD